MPAAGTTTVFTRECGLWSEFCMNEQFTYNDGVFGVGHSAKEAIRATTRRQRATMEHSLIDVTLTDHLLDWLGPTSRVAAYSPLPGEPGGVELVAALAAKHDLWLPITPKEGDLRWGRFVGELHEGAHFGIGEPEGPGEASLSMLSCDAVIVPALAVDRHGVRLGQGAGYYDRALDGVKCPVVALVYDSEVYDELPREPHDQPVDATVTQSGFMWLGTGRGGAAVQ